MKSIKIFLFIFLATVFIFPFGNTKIANATGDVTVSVTIVVNYTLTYTAGAGGTITGDLSQVTSGGSGTEVTAVPNANYHFVDWDDGITTSKRTDTNVTDNISVQANFAINTYTLTYEAGTGGTILGSTTQTIIHGQNGALVMAYASAGYIFASWDDGLSTVSRTDLNITANKTVRANFTAKTAPSVSVIEPATSITSNSATLSAEVTSNGNDSSVITRSICLGTSPSPTSCNSGGTGLGTYSYDATSLTPDTVYYFRGKAANDTGTAYSGDGSFRTLLPDAIVVLVNPNPSEYNVSREASVNFTYTSSTSSGEGTECRLLNNTGTPFSGYPGSMSINAPSGVGDYLYFIQCRDTITTSAVITSGEIHVYTKPIVTVNQTSNGTIAPSTGEVIYNSSPSYTITPSTNYAIESLTIDGSAITVAGSHTFSNIIADHTISATYILNNCSAPTYQEVTGIQCDLNSNGDSAISGSVTRSQVKSPPLCTFPSPLTVDNSLYVRHNCEYPLQQSVPSVSSPTATDVNSSGATVGATVDSLGTPASISARGVCYGGSLNPSLLNATCVSASTATLGSFSIPLELSSGALYHYRGYATNATGTGYSSDATFNTGSDPDLISSAVTYPANMIEGVSQNLSTRITNQGGGWTEYGFSNLLVISTGPAGTGTVSEAVFSSGYYDPGDSIVINFGVTFPSAGTYYALSCADTRGFAYINNTGDVVESDDRNNCGTWVTLTVGSLNTLPLAPTISWISPVYTEFNHPFDVSGTDPDEDQVRYGIDWNNDDIIEAIDWTSLVNSGTSLFPPPTHSWINPGNYSIKAKTKDSKDALSLLWSPVYTVTVVSKVKIISFTVNPESKRIPVGGSVTLTWITSDATGGCTMKAGSVPVNMSDVPDKTNGSKTFTPTTTKKVRYTLTCLGDNNSIDSEFRDITVGNIKPIYTEF